VLCAGLNLAETALVIGFDHGARPYLAPQASAVAPLGVFGDLRWVSVYQDSWAALAGEVAAMVAVRGALTALAVALAWPAHLPCPSARKLLSRGTFATLLAAVLLAPSVALLFGLAAVPVSWLFLAAVPAALLVAFVLHPAAVSGDWWQRLVAPRAVAWVTFAFVTLSLASAVMAVLPVAVAPVISALSGLFNAWSWTGLVHAVTDRRPVQRAVPVALLAVLALIGTVAGGTVIGFSLAGKAGPGPTGTSGPPAQQAPAGPVAAVAPARRTERAVLLVSGYGSSWDGRAEHPVPGNFTEESFSYRGLGPREAPLAYTGQDTAKPLLELDRMLLAQVASLRKSTGLPVDVVAESEGALVAKTALLAYPDRAVATLVLASPLESPGRVWYPTTGAQGWGVATNRVMRLLSDAFQGVAPINLSLDNPLFASLDQQAPTLEDAMSCPIAGIHQFALLPLADATVTPATQDIPFSSVVLPAFHGGLLEKARGEQIVARVLTGRPVGDDRLLTLADQIISDASSAWQVPSLVPSDYPVTANRPRAAHGLAGNAGACDDIAAELREAMSARAGRS
jgi:hypothetical protein